MSNFKFSLPEKRSAWSMFRNFAISMSRFSVDFDAVVATSSSVPKSTWSAGRLVSADYALPSVLDDANPLYHPFLVGFILRNNVRRYSLVHHLAFSTRGMNSFNVGALLNLYNGVPFLIGPAEVHHLYSIDDFRLYGKHLEREESELRVPYRVASLVGSSTRPLLGLMMSRVLDKCDSLVAVNEGTKTIYSRYMSSNKIEVIPTGIDTRKFSAISPKKGPPSVIMIGNLIERKGYRTVVMAIKQLAIDFPDVSLNIVGTGPLESELKSSIRKLNLEESIHLQGNVNDSELRELLSEATVFCHASYSESYSYTILEAMSAGLPVVCTDILGSSGMVEDCANGMVVIPGDASGLANALGGILSNPQLVEKMRMESRKRVVAYDWKAVSQRYYELYQRLAG